MIHIDVEYVLVYTKVVESFLYRKRGFLMDRSYPDRHCPASLFELRGISRGLWEVLEKRGYPLDLRNYTDEVFRYVEGAIGSIGQLSDLTNWYHRYRDLWTPVLRHYYGVEGYSDQYKSMYDSYILMSRIMVREGLKDSLGLAQAQEIANGYIDSIQSPWIQLFIEWDTVGRKEYVVSQGLSSRLKNTVLKGYPCSSFKLPYDSFYINLRNYGEFSDVALEGCLVSYFAGKNKFGIYIIPRDGVNSKHMIQSLGADLEMYSTLDETLKASFEMVHADLKVGSDELKELTQHYQEPWERLFRYVVNVVLYATMPDAESEYSFYDPNYQRSLQKLKKHKKGSKKHTKAKEALRKASKAGYEYLGGSIRVDRSLEREGSRGSGDGSRTLTVRSLVSGHWRDQPYGPGMAYRKRIWIEPFWRGPEGVPITQRPHNLK